MCRPVRQNLLWWWQKLKSKMVHDFDCVLLRKGIEVTILGKYAGDGFYVEEEIPLMDGIYDYKDYLIAAACIAKITYRVPY